MREGQKAEVGGHLVRPRILRGSGRVPSRRERRGLRRKGGETRTGGGVRRSAEHVFSQTGEGLAWPGGWTIQPSFHSGMHALVIFYIA